MAEDDQPVQLDEPSTTADPPTVEPAAAEPIAVDDSPAPDAVSTAEPPAAEPMADGAQAEQPAADGVEGADPEQERKADGVEGAAPEQERKEPEQHETPAHEGAPAEAQQPAKPKEEEPTKPKALPEVPAKPKEEEPKEEEPKKAVLAVQPLSADQEARALDEARRRVHGGNRVMGPVASDLEKGRHDYEPDYIYVMVFPYEEDFSQRTPIESAAKFEKRKRKAKEYRESVIERLHKCGLVVTKHLSRDLDEVFVKISATPSLLAYLAEHTDQTKLGAPMVKIKSEKVQAVIDAAANEYEKLQIVGGYCAFKAADVDMYEGERSPTGEYLFRSKDAQKLISVRMETPVALGGAGINPEMEFRAGRLNQFFAIHHKAEVDNLLENWANFSLIYKDWLSIPTDDIKDYFGEEVALYFCYLRLYTWWLVPASLLGLVVFVYQMAAGGYDSRGAIMAYAVVMIFWGTLFLEAWKREQITLAHAWGTIGVEETEPLRPEFIAMADCTKNVLTNEKEYSYPESRKWCRYLLTYGLPIFLVLVAFTGIIAIFFLRFWLEKEHDLGALAGIVNGVVINGFNEIYKILAEKLCSYEPLRTDTEFNDALITKVFLFQFVNSYSSLYMVAFVKSNAESLGLDDWFGECKCTDYEVVAGNSAGKTDADQCTQSDLANDICICNQPDCIFELAWLLLTIFGVQLVIGNVMEFVVPWFQAKLKMQAEEELLDDGEEHNELTEAEVQAKLHPYMRIDMFNDYNEMILQLGFITLFSPAFPLVALMGLVNNLVELRSDSNKLCRVYQRPQATPAEDIGTWENILDIMTYIAVATNVGLVWFATSFRDDYGETTRVWGFVVTEHVAVMIKIWIAWAIPDVPEETKKRIDAQTYLTNKALGLMEETAYDTATDPFYFPDATDEGALAPGDTTDPVLNPPEEEGGKEPSPQGAHSEVVAPLSDKPEEEPLQRGGEHDDDVQVVANDLVNEGSSPGVEMKPARQAARKPSVPLPSG